MSRDCLPEGHACAASDANGGKRSKSNHIQTQKTFKADAKNGGKDRYGETAHGDGTDDPTTWSGDLPSTTHVP